MSVGRGGEGQGGGWEAAQWGSEHKPRMEAEVEKGCCSRWGQLCSELGGVRGIQSHS